MRRVALRGLVGRPLRTLLTMLAVVLGVAMVTGSSVLGATMQRAFDVVFSSAYASTDVVVSGKSVVEWSESGAPTLPTSLLARVREVEGVERAAGAILDFSANAPYAIVVGPDGEKLSGDPSFMIGFEPEDERFNPLRLSEGRWAARDDEVVLDGSTAERGNLAVGDRVEIGALGPSRTFEVVGLAGFGDVDSLGGATMAVFDSASAQRLLEKDGRLDAISIAAAPGVDAATLVERLRPLVPAGVQVQTADEKAAADKEDIALFVDVITWVLRGFGGVVLFVGAFVIVNTLSITVAQRTRELATLRMLGATRSQVRRSVALESLVLGAVASALGVGLGIALAIGLKSLLVSFGLDFPSTALAVTTSAIVSGLIVGTVVTLLAGVVPATRATRVAPVEAVREGYERPRGRFARIAPSVGGALAVAGIGLLALGMARDLGVAGVLLASLGGMLLLFVGAMMAVPVAVPAIVAVVGWPGSRLGGVAGRLARRNAVRNPGRTAATAAALMIGLALVTAVAVLGRSLKDTATRAASSQLGGTHVLQSDSGWETLPVGSAAAIGDAPRVEALAEVRYDRGKVGKKEVDVSGVDTLEIDGLYRFTWEAGNAATLARLGRDGALVRDDLAEQRDLVVGDRFSMLTAAGREVSFVVRGIVAPPRFDALLGHVTIGARSTRRFRSEPTYSRSCGSTPTPTSRRSNVGSRAFPTP